MYGQGLLKRVKLEQMGKSELHQPSDETVVEAALADWNRDCE